MNNVQKASAEWQAQAIEACLENPEYAAKVAAGKWCAVCDMRRPCLCDDDDIAREMLAHWKRHKKGNLQRALAVNWGKGDPMHELMLDLIRIVERSYNRQKA